MSYCIYLSHPNVEVNPALPVPQWDLSDIGRQRIYDGLRQPWLVEIDHVVTSAEKKAVETGQIIANHLGIDVQMERDMHENDRSTTGFLPEAEFQAAANEFFANPESSFQGWETAIDAQTRIVNACKRVLSQIADNETVLFAGHGGVGTLLRCYLAGVPIAREYDQPSEFGGGCWFRFEKAQLNTQSAHMDALKWGAFEPEPVS